MANKLDAVSSLSFDNYALASYYREKGEWNKLLLSMEAVPSPDFHWWNYMMGLANHHLGNTEKSKEFFSIIQNLYGDNPIEKHKKGNRMWNMESIFIEREMEILISEYY